MRIAIAVMVLAGTAAAEPCKEPLACEKACSAHDTRACTVAAEAIFDGSHGAPFDPKRSFPLAKTACDAGDAFGCSLLAYHYQDGSGVAWSPQLAVANYDKACRGGSGVGCYNLAGMYGGGHGIDVDNAKYDSYTKLARAAWQAACDRGESRWCSNLGFLIETAGDHAAARKLYAKTCAAGVVVGCVEMTRVTFEQGGLTAPAFIAELDRMCSGGEPIACAVESSYLGIGDKGVTKDAKRALQLSKHACDTGDASSCLTTGLMLISNDGVPVDYVAAERYFTDACDRRVAKACLLLAQKGIRAADKSKGLAFARRACETNEAEGCEIVAAAATSEAEIVKWSREGCRRGRYDACLPLVDRDLAIPAPPSARPKVYRQACTDGHKAACKHVN
jgi:TPR repeat protein